MNLFSPRPARLVSSGFGSGYAPFSPGTFGSAAATAVWAFLLYFIPAEPYVAGLSLLIITLVAAVPAVTVAVSTQQLKDPSWIVIDEWAGIFITFAIAPQTDLFGIALGFALFRVFDFVKAGRVGWAERFKGA